jgi:hypothetical protein
VTGAKPIAICPQSISGVSDIGSLVAFYDIPERKGEVLYSSVPNTTRDNLTDKVGQPYLSKSPVSAMACCLFLPLVCHEMFVCFAKLSRDVAMWLTNAYFRRLSVFYFRSSTSNKLFKYEKKWLFKKNSSSGAQRNI